MKLEGLGGSTCAAGLLVRERAGIVNCPIAPHGPEHARKATSEGDGTLLDHSLVLYGAGISDGNAHNHDELPILVAGAGNGAVTPGRHLRFPRKTPLCNLYLSLLDRAGVRESAFGDSDGRLDGI